MLLKVSPLQDCSGPAEQAGSHVTTQKPLGLSAQLTLAIAFTSGQVPDDYQADVNIRPTITCNQEQKIPCTFKGGICIV